MILPKNRPIHAVIPYPLAAIILLLPATLYAQRIGEFDVSNASIPLHEIHRGGPPKDGIPAIDHPRFLPATTASFLRDKDIVLGVNINGETRTPRVLPQTTALFPCKSSFMARRSY